LRNLRQYLEKLRSDELPTSLEEELNEDRLMQEFVFLGLRTSTGISLSRLRDEYGYSLSAEGESLVSDLRNAGMLEKAGDRVILTLGGFLVADSITSALLTRDAIAHSR
jgi:oxygen-independent coproporphyrinogen-3 oxidase